MISTLLIIILSPIFIFVFISIKIIDGSPVIFKQRRYGINNTYFTIYKFRTMKHNINNLPSSRADINLVTSYGKIIRRLNIDELPQLFNIVRGDMSLVGPRPALYNQLDLIKLRNYNGSSNIRPGLTGLAQINSYDGMKLDVKSSFDGEYQKKITLINDLLIILRTLKYLLNKPPIY